jgi:DHA3 family macrolide efflux protein-like MFS transporter
VSRLSATRTAIGRSVVLERPFSSVFAAQSATELADQIFLVTLAWGVLATGTGSDLGLVLTAWAAPRGIFLLAGGVLIDRGDRRVIGAGAGFALSALVGLLALAFSADAAELPVWLGAAVVLGLLDGVRLPIGYTLIPLLVAEERVLDANRWSQLRLWTALALGPPLGGVLVALAGVPAAFLVVSALFAVSAVLLLTLPSLKVRREEPTSVVADLADGFRLVSRHERLRVLLPVFAGVNLFVLGLLAVGIPVFVKNGLDGGADDLGLVMGSWGAGLMAGTISMVKWPEWPKTSMAGLFVLFALSDLCLALIGVMPGLWLACGAFFLSGYFIGPASTLYQALIQSTTPKEYLGRVTGMARAISFGLEPVSAALIGSLTRVVSSGVLVLGGGLAAMTIDLFGVAKGRAIDRRRGESSMPPSEVSGAGDAAVEPGERVGAGATRSS